MPTKRRSEAARRNGAKSRGPVTEAGKQASSVNSIKHGIHSTRVVLSTENPEQYERLLAAYLHRYQPADPVEEALVVDAVNARWRLQRAQQLETALVDLHVASVLENPELPKDIGPVYVCARAHQLLSDNSRALADLHRHEARLTRTYRKSLDMLRDLQAERGAAEEEIENVESATNEKSKNEPNNAQVHPSQPDTSSTHPARQRPDTHGGPSFPITPTVPERVEAELCPPACTELPSPPLNGRNTSFKQPDGDPRIC